MATTQMEIGESTESPSDPKMQEIPFWTHKELMILILPMAFQQRCNYFFGPEEELQL